jgi:hypothetical protein
MTEERWRAAVGAGLGVAATLGWVAAGTSNAHADADEAEVISNWSNAHQCQAPGALLATPPRPIKREGAYSACVHTSMLASWCGVERVDTRVRRTRELRVRGCALRYYSLRGLSALHAILSLRVWPLRPLLCGR